MEKLKSFSSNLFKGVQEIDYLEALEKQVFGRGNRLRIDMETPMEERPVLNFSSSTLDELEKMLD